ncbi:MAG: deoxyribose-phosphate aldolase [Candidatus Korarchaeota archaeon]|nr:deoxyribose-phosphate aldolase [Candidatus Korarchaeota archaeon]
MDLRGRIDATLLKHDVSLSAVVEFAERAAREGMRSVVVYPFYAQRLTVIDMGIPICTVVGFPHGSQLKEAKVGEAKLAREIGVSEIDYVISIPAVKNGLFDYLKEEADLITAAFSGTVKAIIEVPLLSENELKSTLEALESTDVEYVKTSTGLYRPVTPDDVRRIKELTDKKIKASGGIRTKEQAIELVSSGADVLGTSKPFDIL